MISVIFYLLLTPQADVPFIDSLPTDYVGCTIGCKFYDRDKIIDSYYLAARLLSSPHIEDCSRTNEWCHREAARLFLFDMLTRRNTPEDVLYLLGRMQGRQYLWQRHPDYPDWWCWLDELKN